MPAAPATLPSGAKPSGPASTEKPSLPARYIRTFAGDIETLKRGERPELAPYTPETKMPAVPEDTGEVSKPVSAEAPLPAPAALETYDTHLDEMVQAAAEAVHQPPLGSMPESAPDEESREDVLARLRAKVAVERAGAETSEGNPEERLVSGSTLPPEAPPVEDEIPSLPDFETPEGPTPLHTYAADFSEHVKDTNASHASILAAEEDAARAPGGAAAPASHTGLYVGIGIILLLLGAGGLYYAYTLYAAHPVPVVIAPQPTAPIFVDERATVSGTGTALAQAVEQSATQTLKAGAVRELYFPSAANTADASVFAALQLPIPGLLSRNIVTAGSMAGIVHDGVTEAPFFIVSVSSYSDTFAGMLSWETSMPKDLALFYPPLAVPASETPAPSAATTTATTTASAPTTPAAVLAMQTPGFEDETLDNHDARVYRDAYGRALVVYGYWDQHTLVIARDPAAFTEIIGRLATSRTQ